MAVINLLAIIRFRSRVCDITKRLYK
jgi:hypothetical protein